MKIQYNINIYKHIYSAIIAATNDKKTDESQKQYTEPKKPDIK